MDELAKTHLHRCLSLPFSFKRGTDIEQSRIHVRYFLRNRQRIRGDGARVAQRKQPPPKLHGARPHRPVPQQATGKAETHAVDNGGGQQIDNNSVMVACVERNLCPASWFGNASQNIEGPITIERRDPDRSDILDVRGCPPELKRQDRPPTAG